MKRSWSSYGFLVPFLSTLFALRFVQLPFVSDGMRSATYIAAGVFFILGLVLQKRTTIISLGISVISGSLLAVACALSTVHVSTERDVEYFANNTKVQMHGWIITPPEHRPSVSRLTVAADTLVIEGKTYPIQGRVLVSVQTPWPKPSYGDEVKISGTLKRPEKIEDFDYPHYLERSGIRAVMHRAAVEIQNTGSTAPWHARPYGIVKALTRMKQSTEGAIGMILPEPHASLLAGLLTGSKSGLSDRVQESFRISGISHIIAVSGFNVTIVLTLIGGMLFWLPLKKRLPVMAVGIVLFCIFVGGGAPVLRATIMGLLGLLALGSGRISTTRLSILWTAFFMTVLSPLTLWYDVSFQLSFLAVIGIAELSPLFNRLLARVPETLAIRASLVATLAAQIATIPLSVLIFRQVSIIAPITNVLVAPLIPVSMLLGAVSTMLGMLWTPLGLLPAYFTWLALELILKIAAVGEAIPFASYTF